MRLRGLPFRITHDEIRDFFNPLKPVDVRMVKVSGTCAGTDARALAPGVLAPPQGVVAQPCPLPNVQTPKKKRPTGRAFVEFLTQRDFDKALAKNNEHLGP